MIKLVHLFVMFFKIGLFSFGGGYGMLPLIFQSVQEFGMMTSSQFSRLVALSQVTPGPIAVNAATNVGFTYAGLIGSIVATFAVSLPCFVLVVVVMHFMKKFQESRTLDAVMNGIRPVTVALLASAVVFLSVESVFRPGIFSLAFFHSPMKYLNPLSILFCVICVVLNGKFKMSPIRVILLAGIAGAVFIR